MNPFFKKFVPAIALVLCTGTAPAMMNIQPLFAADTTASSDGLLCAVDRLTILEDGTAYYAQGDKLVTGRFCLEPNYLLGDVNNDGMVDANDAASLLIAAAQLGANADALNPAYISCIQTYGDVDGNGSADASDAANILNYCAKRGAGNEVTPFGAAWFYADENGRLMKGRIVDASGEIYYAGEDYKLLTGWYTDDTASYCFDSSGIMLKNTWKVNKNGINTWLDENGCMASDVWAETDAGKCWFDTDGSPAEGLRVIGGQPYYFENCAMQTGWITIGSKTCYAGEDGILCEGLMEIDGDTYYFCNGYGRQTGWIGLEDGLHYFDENGRMCKGWTVIDSLNYCFDENGIRQTGFVSSPEGMCYLDENGVRCTGWQTVDGKSYYFLTDSAIMATGWVDYQNQYYYFDENGAMHTGWLEFDSNSYYMQEDGTMATGRVKVGDKTYDFGTDGISKGEYIAPVSNTGTGKDELLNNAVLSPRRTITVYDQQKGSGKDLIDFTFTLKDKDIEIIEQFAADHFPENASIAEKLYITHQWIHYNTDYAYAGTKWNEIVGLSYVDAIFNHGKGQCVQYNGAMASVLAYYGYEVYMVKGYTRPGVQHFWTQVEIDGHTYMVECGNSGKNGDKWQEFFNLMY